MNQPLMYESIKDCHYALDLVTDEELDIVADDILIMQINIHQTIWWYFIDGQELALYY